MKSCKHPRINQPLFIVRLPEVMLHILPHCQILNPVLKYLKHLHRCTLEKISSIYLSYLPTYLAGPYAHIPLLL